jgi:hypothetical protein
VTEPYEPELWAELGPLRGRLPVESEAEIRAAHERIGFACNAHDEGLLCCLDVLLWPADTELPPGSATR